MKPPSKSTTRDDYRQRMLRVLLHIQRNLDEELPLQELAGVAAFSPYHFHRIFRGMVGESVREHVRRLRIERAAGQLKHGDAPVTTVAFDAGYESHEAFTRAFKARCGMTPSEFRSRNGAGAQHLAESLVPYREDGDLEKFPATNPGGNAMDVKIKTLETMHLAFVRHVGPYDQCGQAWSTLCRHLGPLGLLGPGTRFVGVSHDDPEVTPADKIRYDACAVVNANFEPGGEVGLQIIESADYAVTTHRGPYEKLHETYAALYGQWLPTSGRECRSAASLEFYLNDPERTKPADLLTEIHAPLEPK